MELPESFFRIGEISKFLGSHYFFSEALVAISSAKKRASRLSSGRTGIKLPGSDLDDPCFEAVQPAEILHLCSIVSVKKQLVKSREAQNILRTIKFHLYRYDTTAAGGNLKVSYNRADGDQRFRSPACRGIFGILTRGGQYIDRRDPLALAPQSPRHRIPVAVVMPEVERLRGLMEAVEPRGTRTMRPDDGIVRRVRHWVLLESRAAEQILHHDLRGDGSVIRLAGRWNALIIHPGP